MKKKGVSKATIKTYFYKIIARIRLWYLMKLDTVKLEKYLDAKGYAYEAADLVEYLSYFNITQRKMLAIVYYAYCMYLALEGRRLANYNFKLTDAGPYEELQYYFLGDDDEKIVRCYGDSELDLSTVPYFFKMIWHFCRPLTTQEIMRRCKFYLYFQGVEFGETATDKQILAAAYQMAFVKR